jgi:two-component system, OmpR family, sensor histidine kinase CpxA
MQTARFPLYAKILCWFFLNLLVLGAALFLFGSLHFRAGPELLAISGAGERIRAVSDVIADELEVRPRSEWDDILQRFSKRFGIEFLLFRNNGEQLAGAPMRLPAAVEQRLAERGPRGLLPRPEELPPPNGDPPRRRELPGDGPRPDGPRGGRPPFLLRTEHPRLYWIGMPLRPPERGIEPRRGPATLLLAAPTLSAGNLLIDLTLWRWLAAGAAVFSLLFWVPLVRHITGSVKQIEAAAAAIANGKFNVHVNERRNDELGSLAKAINRMASRLAGFVTGQKRFLGDIAHELCSPIARMQMAVGILQERAHEKDKPYVQDLHEEVQHMSALVNELLSFSKAALGAGNIHLQSLALRPLVDKALKREVNEVIALHNDVPEALHAVGDPELIVRAVSNLVRNAIIYAGDAGPITISAKAKDGRVQLLISDCGRGVPEGELPKLFDPFYRVDSSRARETGGVGLGLSIVKTCVETCGGTVSCRNRQPHGFEAEITLAQQA